MLLCVCVIESGLARFPTLVNAMWLITSWESPNGGKYQTNWENNLEIIFGTFWQNKLLYKQSPEWTTCTHFTGHYWTVINSLLQSCRKMLHIVNRSSSSATRDANWAVTSASLTEVCVWSNILIPGSPTEDPSRLQVQRNWHNQNWRNS